MILAEMNRDELVKEYVSLSDKYWAISHRQRVKSRLQSNPDYLYLKKLLWDVLEEMRRRHAVKL